jgi:hypothetical protein
MSGLERTLALLSGVPTSVPVAVLLRHAERTTFEDPPGPTLELTEYGRAQSEELGRRFGARIRRIAHSPVLRCRQTASAVFAGMRAPVEVMVDERLGGPGLFVEDEVIAGQTFERLGVGAVLSALVAGRQLPGLAHPGRATQAMMDHLSSVGREANGLYLFITHDSLLAPTLGSLFGPDVELPDYLDALVAWCRDGATYARHRERMIYPC